MKIFLFGTIFGIILIFIILIIIGVLVQKSQNNDIITIRYLEHPIRYENKVKSSFIITDVIEDSIAIAKEMPATKAEYEISDYIGKPVMILGSNLYTGKIIMISEPIQIGTYCHEKDNQKYIIPVIKYFYN